MALKLSEEDRTKLQQLEEALWRPETRFDANFLDRVLADDFLEFGRSGRTYTKPDTLSHSYQPIDAVLPLPDFQVSLLSPDVALVTYNSARTIDSDRLHAHRSSIWIKTPTGWQLRFHQGTPYEPQ